MPAVCVKPAGALLRPAHPPSLRGACDVAIWGGVAVLYFGFGECCLSSGTHHPPSPLPGRKGEEIKALWGTPPDPRQRGYAPLHSPLIRPVIARRACNVAIWGGVACCTSASESVVSVVARTIPLAPFLGGRGQKLKLSGGHPQTPGSGATPLCTPCSYVPSLRGACNVAIWGGVTGCRGECPLPLDAPPPLSHLY